MPPYRCGVALSSRTRSIVDVHVGELLTQQTRFDGRQAFGRELGAW